MFVSFISFIILLVFSPKQAYGASGSARVRYNCVNGTNKAECAQICENLRVTIGDLPDPLAGFHLTYTPVQIAQVRRDEIPYYCNGLAVTSEQKIFTGLIRPTLKPTQRPTLEPSPTIAVAITPPVTATTEVETTPSPPTFRNIILVLLNWLRSFL